MSEVSTPIENEVAAVADTAVDAVASVSTVAEPAVRAKRAYKKRVARPAEPVIEAVRKVNNKAGETVARRKYTRKPAVAAVAAAAPQSQGTNTMTYEAPNWFAGFNALPGADKFQGMFADVGEKSQEAVRKSQAFAEQLTEAARANVEAVVESSRIAVAGVRDLGQEVLASSRGGVEQASSAVKTLAEAKSPTEFFQLHSELVRSSFDRFVAEGSKFTEQVVKLAGEAVQPLSNRASVNAEKFSELTA